MLPRPSRVLVTNPDRQLPCHFSKTVLRILGQPDGSFAPDRSITRAEAMTTINRVLGRLPGTADDLLDDMIAWPDNPPDAWYYLAVQEATNSHDYERKADTVHETWTGLQPAGNWAQYQ